MVVKTTKIAVLTLKNNENEVISDIFALHAELEKNTSQGRILGFGHDRINRWLCEHWNLPLVICEGMVYHHDPFRAQFHPEIAAIVQLGDFFARVYDCGFAGDRGVNTLDPRGMKMLGLNQKMVEELADSIGEEIFNVLAQLRG